MSEERSQDALCFPVVRSFSLENESFQEVSFLSVLFLFHFTVTPLGFVELLRTAGNQRGGLKGKH